MRPTGHAIDGEESNVLARSLDGGETWKLEDPENYFGDGGRAMPSPGIDFVHPGFAMRIQKGTFRISYDRARTWQGPYTFPGLDFRLSGVLEEAKVLKPVLA